MGVGWRVMEGLSKKEKNTHGHKQQCGDCWGEGVEGGEGGEGRWRGVWKDK